MPQITCQFCGRANEITVVKPASAYGVPWKPYHPMADSAQRPRFGDVAEVPNLDIKEASRRSQSRAPNERADVLVPFGRTVGTMIFISLPAGIAIAWGNDYPLRDFGIVFFAVNAGAWLLFTGLSEASIWVFERITGKDIDGDDQIGRPDHVEFTIKREDKDIEGDSWERGKLPCPNGQMQYLEHFCQAIIDGYATFSERGSREDSKDPKKGAAHFGYNTRLWDKLRDGFVDREWAYWPGERRQGVAFTDIGEQVAREIAEGNFVP